MDPTPAPSPLQRDLRQLEGSLLRRWHAGQGAAPAGLRAYRARWLAEFSGPLQACSAADFQPALAQGRPLLVSDFHALPRAQRMLATLLRELAWIRPPRLILELLPAELQLEAPTQAELDALRLVDGRRLGRELPELAEAILEGGLALGGAWVDGPPEERDHRAAEAWQRAAAREPERPQVLFFGDWHLAHEHLPARLRERGAAPVVLHQSPAPLWAREAGAPRAPYLRLGPASFAWMHTRPLAYWSATAPGPAPAGEQNANLIEELAAGLAELWDLPRPSALDEVFRGADWPGFHRALPQEWRAALDPARPARCVLGHPHEPWLWLPTEPSWNHLIEAAAELLTRGSALSAPGREAQAAAFRRTLARAWNPFLPTRRLAELAQARGLPPRAFLACTRRDPRSRMLAAALLGERVAEVLHAHPLLDRAGVRTWLRDGRRAFLWDLGLSTIHASPVSA